MSILDALMTISPLTVLISIVSFVVALVIIVFVHEFGHFIVGRWCGVGIEAFSVGFGKELFGFNDKYGTRWKFCALPLGGYVKFEGDANPASMPDASALRSPTNLHGKPVLQRMAIVAAGPLANFLLSITIFALLAMFVGYSYYRPTVSVVLPGSAAQEAGLLPGDTFKSIDGVATPTFDSVIEAVFLRPGEPLLVVIDRAGKSIDLTLTPKPIEISDNFGGKIRVGQFGVSHERAADEPVYQKLGPVAAIAHGVGRTWGIITTTVQFIGKIINGQQDVNQLGGSVMIGKHAGDAASAGPLTFILFIAFFSVSVGFINLFPIPMLDGGHLVFYALEGIRGRPLGQVAQEWSYRFGLSCVLMLILLVHFNDAGRVTNVLFGT